jgi:hypothetical protein
LFASEIWNRSLTASLKLLPSPDISFRRLHGRVTEKKLNLFEFACRAMAELSTGTTKVMRRKMVYADPLGILPYCRPNNIRSDSTKTALSLPWPVV